MCARPLEAAQKLYPELHMHVPLSVLLPTNANPYPMIMHLWCYEAPSMGLSTILCRCAQNSEFQTEDS